MKLFGAKTTKIISLVNEILVNKKTHCSRYFLVILRPAKPAHQEKQFPGNYNTPPNHENKLS